MDPVEESAGRDGAAERATAALRFVFISYASQDVTAADNVCAALEKARQPCWIAPRDVRPGEPYAAAIVESVRGRATAHSRADPLPAAAAAPAKQKPDPWRSGPVLVLAGLVLALLGYFAVDKLWLSKSSAVMAAGGSPLPIPRVAWNSAPAPGGS